MRNLLTRIAMASALAPAVSGGSSAEADELWELFAPKPSVVSPVVYATDDGTPAAEPIHTSRDGVGECKDSRELRSELPVCEPSPVTDHAIAERQAEQLLGLFLTRPLENKPADVTGDASSSVVDALGATEITLIKPTPCEPITESVATVQPTTPLGEILLGSDEIVRVAEAIDRLPSSYTRGWSEVGATVPTQALLSTDGTSVLMQPIFTISLDAAADAEVLDGIANLGEEFAIEDQAIERFGSWQAPRFEATLAPARFGPMAFHWAAPAVYTRPLYFEQPNLERYGHYVACHERDNLTQSFISSAHFFATVPVLPYKMGADHPDECSYVLGSFRPGSCNPHQLIDPKASLRGLVYQGITITGLIFLLP